MTHQKRRSQTLSTSFRLLTVQNFVAAVSDDPNALEGVRSYALDPENAKRLWSLSEELVGQTFTL